MSSKGDKTPITDSHELLMIVERKDARFRIFQAIFTVLVIIGLLVLLSLTYKVQSENNILIKDQNNILVEQKQATLNLKDHIDCIVTLFSQSNRPSLVISDVDNCKISTVNP